MLSNFKNKRKEKNKQIEEIQFIIFQLGEEKFGVDVKQAKEIISANEFTNIPNSPGFVMGVIDLRGSIIPIINLKNKLGLKFNESSEKDEKIIIVEIDGNFIGMQVDNVNEMLRMNVDEISSPPKIVKGINSSYIKGVGHQKGKLLILLNLDKILSEKELLQLSEMDIE